MAVQIRVWVGGCGWSLGGFWVGFKWCLGRHLGQSLGGVWVRFRWSLGLRLDWCLGGNWVDVCVGGCFDGSDGLFWCLLVLVVGFNDGCFGGGGFH